MAPLAFGTVSGTVPTTTDITQVRIARSLKPKAEVTLAPNISLVGLVRSPGPIAALMQPTTEVDLKRRLKLGTATGWTAIETNVQFFLNAIATAPPIGGLSMASINKMLNPLFVAPGLGGQRFVKGDLIAIEFKVRGQKLAGLNARFTACRTDQPIGSPHDIDKSAPGAIRQTVPVLDTSSGVETMTGSFNLTSADTSSLPNPETQFVYEFQMSDGLGRIHTLESGKFVIYTNC